MLALILYRLMWPGHILAYLPTLQEVAPPDLAGLIVQFAALAGVAGLIAILINAGKAAGIVKDGQAPRYSLALNTVAFAGLAALRIFRPDLDVTGYDQAAGQIATILTAALGLWVQFGASKVANNSVKGLPVIGFSYSRQAEQRQLAEFAAQASSASR